jgi:hypothetical protein
MFDREGIHAAHREIKIHAAKYFDTGHLFAYHIGERRGWLVVVLEYQAAHAPAFCQARKVDGINRARRAVGRAMGVDIDHPGEGIFLGEGSHHDAKSKEKSQQSFHSHHLRTLDFGGHRGGAFSQGIF